MRRPPQGSRRGGITPEGPLVGAPLSTLPRKPDSARDKNTLPGRLWGMPSSTADAEAQTPERSGDEAAHREWLRGLFAAISEGAPLALEALYESVADRLYGFALWKTGNPDDACDVVQEVFLRVVASRERLGRVEEPLPWLLGLAHHVAADAARRARRRPAGPLDEAALLVEAGVDAGRRVDAERASGHLASLPAAQRDAVYLRHFADCSFAAIGRITGVSVFTAASRYRLGIGKLRRLMETSR
jgi:RNA polymerase sigma-70 factor, ECF subfamily